MKYRRSYLIQLRRFAIVAVVAPGLAVSAAVTAAAGPAAPTQSQQVEHRHAHGAPPKAPVAPPKVAPPPPLPRPRGTVTLNRSLRIAGPVAAPQQNRTAPTAPAPTAPAPRGVAPNAVESPAPAEPAPSETTPGTAAESPAPAAADAGSGALAAAAVADPNKVGVRALVIGIDANDYGLPTWKAMLDRTGAAYDVLLSKDTPLSSETLVRPDGAGKYNAVLLTDAMLLHQDASAGFVSALSADEWNLLWAYERDYKVRQVALFASYGSFPEDYCLRAGSEGAVGDAPLNATLTATGRGVFDYLKSNVQIPITQSWVYRDTLAAGCGAQSVLTAGAAVLGVQSTSTDGRERMALTFSSNQYLMQAHLLTYGLFRWASRGLFYGERRHYLNADVDDWFNSTDQLREDGTLNSDPGFSMTAHDAYNARTRQNQLRTRYPLATAFRLAMAFNSGDANMAAGTTCSPNGGTAQLTATSRCIRNDVRWLNHTLTHPKMNFTDYATSLAEIRDNLTRAQTLGLPTPANVLKTGEYSGLGVYHPDVNNDVDPPTDHGLEASNTNLLRAAKDAGVKYLHGNMSFASHVPACFNCAKVHPLESSLLVVPDWPTNIAYFSTTPAEETYFYNSYYGPNGKFPFWPTDRTYAQILEIESDQALSHVATGSIYTHTLHIGNLRDYGSGRTLTTDWLDRIMAKYTALYSVPLLSPDWATLAAYTEGRNAHFAELEAGVDAVYDRVANTVTVSSPADGSVTVSGARTTGFTTYGTDVSARITLTAGTPVTFTPSLRP